MFSHKIFFILLLLLGFQSSRAAELDLKSLTSKYGFRLKPSLKLELVKNESQEALGKAFQKIFLKNKKADIEIEIEILGPTDEKNAKLIIDSAYRTIEEVNANSGGFTSIAQNKAGPCSEGIKIKKLTKKILGKESLVFFAKANAQKAIGTCAQQDAVFDALFYMFQTTQGYLVKTSLFTVQKNKQSLNTKQFTPYMQVYEAAKINNH